MVANARIQLPSEQIQAFCAKWKVREFSLFGSVLREDFCPSSDIDVLVSFNPGAGWSLWDLFDMQDELEALYGRHVDLIEKEALRNPFRRHEILTTRQVLYAAEKSDASYLRDMLTAARAVVEFTRGRTLNDYAGDLFLRSAVERQIEIIGEAARRITSKLKKQHPEIPWDKITRQRHVLAHDYGEIEHERIWRVATTHVPALIDQLAPLIPPPPPT